jgi:2,3-bisphosphoglycerate-independent phosphoglycerate mutase
MPQFPEHRVEVKYATEHRCGVVIHGRGLSDAVTGTDPLKDGLPLRESQPADGTAEVGCR